MIRDRAELGAAVRGYWAARAILAASELGVFTALGRRRLAPDTVAARIGADARATSLLLHALAGQGVLVKEGRSFRIAEGLLEALTPGPGSALSMLAHHERLWAKWDRLTESVRTGRPAAESPGFAAGPAEARLFTRAMRDGAVRFAAAVADEIAAEIDLAGRRRLADLGGGPGIYAAELARLHPELEVVVMDLPDVVAAGEEILAELTDRPERVSFHPGDVERDPLPDGIDAALLSHVIHGMGEPAVRRLFARIREALPRGGLLVVRDFFLDPDRVRPASASLFSLNMLVATPAGRCYTAAETTAWLRDAGFGSVRRRRSSAAPDADYLFARAS